MANDFKTSAELPPIPGLRFRHFAGSSDYAAMNAVYATYFAPGRFPGRTCVGVTGLALGALVEIDLVVRS